MIRIRKIKQGFRPEIKTHNTNISYNTVAFYKILYSSICFSIVVVWIIELKTQLSADERSYFSGKNNVLKIYVLNYVAFLICHNLHHSMKVIMQIHNFQFILCIIYIILHYYYFKYLYI